MLILKRLLELTMTSLIVSGCAFFLALSPHENFKEILYGNIGRNVDNIPPYALGSHETELIGSKVLPNGNIENKYKHLRSCRYIFEIDSNTRKIVGARFEGSDADCVINP